MPIPTKLDPTLTRITVAYAKTAWESIERQQREFLDSLPPISLKKPVDYRKDKSDA